MLLGASKVASVRQSKRLPTVPRFPVGHKGCGRSFLPEFRRVPGAPLPVERRGLWRRRPPLEAAPGERGLGPPSGTLAGPASFPRCPPGAVTLGRAFRPAVSPERCAGSGRGLRRTSAPRRPGWAIRAYSAHL